MIEIIKKTPKACFLKKENVEFWVQKRWFNEEKNSLTPSGLKSFEEAKNNPVDKSRKKTLCYSIRLSEYRPVGEAYFLKAFDGSSCFVPKSCVLGEDFGTVKSSALWVASWILAKKNIQYSSKKQRWF